MRLVVALAPFVVGVLAQPHHDEGEHHGGGHAGPLSSCNTTAPCSRQCGRYFVPLVSECAAFFEAMSEDPPVTNAPEKQVAPVSFLQQAWEFAESCPDPVESTRDLLTADLPYAGRPGVVAALTQCGFVGQDGAPVVGSDLAGAFPRDPHTCDPHGCAHTFNTMMHRCTRQLPEAMGCGFHNQTLIHQPGGDYSIRWKPWFRRFQRSCGSSGGKGGPFMGGEDSSESFFVGGKHRSESSHPHRCEANRFRALFLLCDLIDSHSAVGRRSLQLRPPPHRGSPPMPTFDYLRGSHRPDSPHDRPGGFAPRL
eukprot:COSAG02_NODE_16530_length_1076_cov_1.426817_1_plen_308_part_10